MERDEVEMESVECFFKKFVCEVFWGLNTRSLFLVGGKIALFFFFQFREVPDTKGQIEDSGNEGDCEGGLTKGVQQGMRFKAKEGEKSKDEQMML